MAKWVRLWGKKRGSRMSGWWVVGSLSEAVFFGLLFLLGIMSLTIVVTWQVFWPESTILGPGFGFWVMVIASISFMVIGLTAFILQVSQTLASPERRSALASRVKEDHVRRAEGLAESNSTLPSLKEFTDSPGVELSFRLATQTGENTQLILSSLFTVTWNSMVAVLAVFWVQGYLSGQMDWLLTVLIGPFALVSFFTTRWFVRLFLRQARLGKTAVEIDRIPLLPGEPCQLYVCQYGKVSFSSLCVSLVSYEETTYQQGTDVRTEIRETNRVEAEVEPRCQDVAISGTGEVEKKKSTKLEAEPEVPLELDCAIHLPMDIMHSFQGEHSAVVWKVVVEGESVKWPGFCRKFPVVVYPRSAV